MLCGFLLLLASYAYAAETLPVADAPPESEVAAATPVAWEATAFEGIDTLTIRLTEPYPMALSAVRVDLATNPRFLVTPQNGEAPLDTHSETAVTFMKRHGCQVVINGSPYAPVVGKEGEPQDVLGMSASNGDFYSQDKVDFSAVFLDKEGKVAFGKRPPDGMAVQNALGGFHMLLEDGKCVASGPDRHPRSAIGVSQDGRYLYLAVRDGRQPPYSIGATTTDMAAWMKRLGAHTALNLDGGGSSALVLQGPGGTPQVLNTPCNLGIPGVLRPNANHLGVFAGARK